MAHPFFWATAKIRRNGSNVPYSFCGYASANRAPYSASNCLRRSSGNDCSTGRAPVPFTHSSTALSPASTWKYVVSHASTTQPSALSTSTYSAGPGTSGRSDASFAYSAYGSVSASSRRIACDGAFPFPGIWIASHPPGRNARTNPGSRSTCSGTHCSVALVTITSSDPGSAVHSRTSPNSKLRWSSAYSAAASSICGELSMPRMTASGQTSRSVAVSAPGPQPRSTTVRTSVACTRSTRSRNGRARSSAYVPYCSGLQSGDVRICGTSLLRFILTSRYSSPATCLDVKSLDG